MVLSFVRIKVSWIADGESAPLCTIKFHFTPGAVLTKDYYKLYFENCGKGVVDDITIDSEKSLVFVTFLDPQG